MLKQDLLILICIFKSQIWIFAQTTQILWQSWQHHKYRSTYRYFYSCGGKR